MRYKILLVSAFNKPWDNSWYYKAGLENNRHIVFSFDPALVPNPVDRIFEQIKEFKPDFILHTKNEFSPGVFEELRRFTRVIQWYPDLVIQKWLPPYVRASDIFFTIAEGLVQEFKKFNSHVFWLTQAFEPSHFEIKEITEEDMKTFSTEVTFVGSLGSKQYYLKRRELLKRVINEGFKLKWWGPRIPHKLITIPLIFGKLGRSYGGKFVWGEEYAKVAKLSKIFLAFDAMPHIKKSMSARMFTAVGCGAFYLCKHVEGIEEVLDPDKEIVTFQTKEEMIDKIQYYLNHGKLRTMISEAGQRRVLREHTYEIRMRQMVKIIEDVIR